MSLLNKIITCPYFVSKCIGFLQIFANGNNSEPSDITPKRDSRKRCIFPELILISKIYYI